MIQLQLKKKKKVQTSKKWYVLALYAENLKLDHYYILKEIKPH